MADKAGADPSSLFLSFFLPLFNSFFFFFVIKNETVNLVTSQKAFVLCICRICMDKGIWNAVH